MRFKNSFFLILKSNKALFPHFFKLFIAVFSILNIKIFCIFRKNYPTMIPQNRVQLQAILVTLFFLSPLCTKILNNVKATGQIYRGEIVYPTRQSFADKREASSFRFVFSTMQVKKMQMLPLFSQGCIQIKTNKSKHLAMVRKICQSAETMPRVLS